MCYIGHLSKYTYINDFTALYKLRYMMTKISEFGDTINIIYVPHICFDFMMTYNEILQKIFNNTDVTIGESQIEIIISFKKFFLRYYYSLAHVDFINFIYRSEPLCILTGDQSYFEGISMGKNIIYDVIALKIPLINDIQNMYLAFIQEYIDDSYMRTLCNDITSGTIITITNIYDKSFSNNVSDNFIISDNDNYENKKFKIHELENYVDYSEDNVQQMLMYDDKNISFKKYRTMKINHLLINEIYNDVLSQYGELAEKKTIYTTYIKTKCKEKDIKILNDNLRTIATTKIFQIDSFVSYYESSVKYNMCYFGTHHEQFTCVNIINYVYQLKYIIDDVIKTSEYKRILYINHQLFGKISDNVLKIVFNSPNVNFICESNKIIINFDETPHHKNTQIILGYYIIGFNHNEYIESMNKLMFIYMLIKSEKMCLIPTNITFLCDNYILYLICIHLSKFVFFTNYEEKFLSECNIHINYLSEKSQILNYSIFECRQLINFAEFPIKDNTKIKLFNIDDIITYDNYEYIYNMSFTDITRFYDIHMNIWNKIMLTHKNEFLCWLKTYQNFDKNVSNIIKYTLDKLLIDEKSAYFNKYLKYKNKYILLKKNISLSK